MNFGWEERRGVIECCQCASVGSFNFQFPIRAVWQIDNWQYWQKATLPHWQHSTLSTAPHAAEATLQCQYKKVRSGGCFAAHLLFFSSSRIDLAAEGMCTGD